MAANNIPQGDLKERVALELMLKIAEKDTVNAKPKSEDPTNYYLRLYSKCLEAVNGEDIDDILENEETTD